MKEKLVFIGDLDNYKNTNKKHINRLVKECERLKEISLPKEHPPTSSTYMGIAIFNLALGYRLTNEEYMLLEAKRFIKAVLGYEKWGNAHLVNLDLSASWILWGLSLGYDWIADYLSEEEKQEILAKIEHHAKIIYDYAKANKKGWTVNYCQNHNWINFNGLATAGYVLKKHINKCEEYYKFAIENFESVFELMPEDGSNYEGVTYWRYGGMWLFIYAHLVKEREGIDFFKTSKYLENTFYYRLYQSGGSLALQTDFGDCHDRHSCHVPAVYYKVAAEYNNGYAQTFANLVLDKYIDEEASESKVKPGILPEAGLELLFYKEDVKEENLNNLSKEYYFEDLGLVSIRSSFNEDARAFSFKCSEPGGKKQWEGFHSEKYEGMELSLSHHHPDNLSYVFSNGRNYFTREDGYNRNIMPTHHSVILVDDLYTDIENANDVYTSSYKERIKTQESSEVAKEYVGTLKKLELDKNYICYKADNTGIYPKKLKMNEVSRTIITSEKLDFILMLNNMKSDENHTYSLVCNTEKMLLEKSANSYTMPMGEDEAAYFVYSDDEITSKQYEQKITAVMTTQEPDKVCVVDINTTQTLSKTPCKQQRIIEIIHLNKDCKILNDNGMIIITTKEDTIKVLTANDCKKHNIDVQKDFAIKINENDWWWI